MQDTTYSPVCFRTMYVKYCGLETGNKASKSINGQTSNTSQLRPANSTQFQVYIGYLATLCTAWLTTQWCIVAIAISACTLQLTCMHTHAAPDEHYI